MGLMIVLLIFGFSYNDEACAIETQIICIHLVQFNFSFMKVIETFLPEADDLYPFHHLFNKSIFCSMYVYVDKMCTLRLYFIFFFSIATVCL